MIQILDFLVKNYTYVAIISAFFTIVLIGFLIKDKKDNTSSPKKDKKIKKNKSKENLANISENVVPVASVEETLPEIEQPKMDNVLNEISEPEELQKENTLPIVNSEKTVQNNEQISTNNIMNEISEPLESKNEISAHEVPKSSYNLELGLEKFKVKLEETTPNVESIAEVSNEFFNRSIDYPSTTETIVENPVNISKTNNDKPMVHRKLEIFDLDEVIMIDRKELDEEIDIIDFSDLNKFESNNQDANPIQPSENDK